VKPTSNIRKALSRLIRILALCLSSFSIIAADANPPPARSDNASVRFQDTRIRESSGLARSLHHPNAVWTHNDSGDSARLFLVNFKTGETLSVHNLSGVQARDWEDMASFTMGNRPMLVVADVGSNRNGKRLRQLHFFDEPLLTSRGSDKPIETPVWATIEFQFEDGYPDCEAIAVDAKTDTVFLATKSKTGKSGLYQLDLPKRAGPSRQSAKRVAPLPLPMITAMDMNPDGDRMLVLTYVSVMEFRRNHDQSWVEAFGQLPRLVRIPPLGKQVEAACYANETNRFHLSSEGRNAPLWTLPLSYGEKSAEESK
jgi:hypothetical protein